MSELKQVVSERLLPCVRQPAQYIGGEINQLAKPGRWESAQVRVAIAFPDTYAVGVSHLGCHILYWICNHIDWACAERVYCPWIDAEQVMRREGIRLFTWDNRHPVGEADFFAVSVQYEVHYSNLLTMLDLAGIPLRSGERRKDDPIVLIGGPQADNPEPLAEFVDLVVVGDGEESLPALLAAYRELKQAGASRAEIIAELAKRFAWCYAPNLYEPAYNADGTLQSLRPRLPDLPQRIERCVVRDFENAPVPDRPLIPWTEAVHDRISIEIMRGCPQACRFCHAGSTKKPVRYRSVERILQIAETAWQATGNDEIGLLSLSTADYPALAELAARIKQQFERRKVNISVPSLRVDKMLSDVPWLAASVRKAGLTIAVEAADEIMRRAIRKKVTDENLLHAVQEAYKAGWRRIKLYFMAGFPGETEDDIAGIWRLARMVSEARRRIAGHPAGVSVSVSWLVPKPFTPLQWAAQREPDYFRHVHRQLKRLERSGRLPIRIKTHGIERSVLEAVFARGDRRLGRVIETAWRSGARFDAWDETFDPRIWQEAFEKEGIDPVWYTHRQRPAEEVFPWDHIAGPDKAWLRRQYEDIFEILQQRSATGRVGSSDP